MSGESLAARLDRLQRLSEDQALRIVHQLASALSATEMRTPAARSASINWITRSSIIALSGILSFEG